MLAISSSSSASEKTEPCCLWGAGRNIHALDPYRMPSAAALERGAQAARAIVEVCELLLALSGPLCCSGRMHGVAG